METRGRSSNNDGAEAATIAVAAIVFFAAIFFAALLPAIAGTIYYAASTIAAFSLTTAILAAWNSRLSARELLWSAIAPLGASLGVLYVAILAYEAIDPAVVSHAQSLLGNGPLRIQSVIGKAIEFVGHLGMDYLLWMTFDMLAFFLISVCMLVSMFQFVHCVALANAPMTGGGIWRALYFRTRRFATAGSSAFMLILLGIAWYLATGHMYHLIK